MNWSPQQELALRRVSEWIKDPNRKPFFYLGGYAGVGKSSLAKSFAEGVGNPDEVLFGAYTGKAAHVLQKKGCPGATTIHRMIYQPKEKSRIRLQNLENELADTLTRLHNKGMTPESIEDASAVISLRIDIRMERQNLAKPSFSLSEDALIRGKRLVVLDECSMISDRMGMDILSFNVPILVLGDPAQLPPVKGEGFFTQNEPDFMLTEIHRQAKENPIIALATRAREKQKLEYGEYGTSRVIRSDQIQPEEVRQFDQIIVGKNATRKELNKRYRERLLGFTSTYPVKGDRLVCLRNNHEIGLLNGAIWICTEDSILDEGLVTMGIRPEDGEEQIIVEAHASHFEGTAEPMDWRERKESDEFDYGYALTCHKSQGSDWNSVMVQNESHVFRDKQHSWLYTALTRASERVTVIQ